MILSLFIFQVLSGPYIAETLIQKDIEKMIYVKGTVSKGENIIGQSRLFLPTLDESPQRPEK